MIFETLPHFIFSIPCHFQSVFSFILGGFVSLFVLPSPTFSHFKVEDNTVHKFDALQKLLPREQQDLEVCL